MDPIWARSSGEEFLFINSTEYKDYADLHCPPFPEIMKTSPSCFIAEMIEIKIFDFTSQAMLKKNVLYINTVKFFNYDDYNFFLRPKD